MNRLVLIGNGFDLAHGLKTSYKSFIFWYWDQWGNRLLSALEKTDMDGLCSFKIKDNVEVPNWASVFQGWYYKRENPFIPWKTNDVINLAMKDRELCDFTITSPLFQRICNHLIYGWVDIENEYYSLLRQRTSKIRPSTEQDITREEIDKLWWNLLSDVLSDKQKKAKVGNMLTKMREERIIVNETKGNVSVWSLLKTKK